MAIFNPYTNTNDFPEISDFYPKDERGNIVFDKMRWPRYGKSETMVLKEFGAAMLAWLDKYKIPQSVRDEWNASQQKGEDYNTFWQRMKAKVSNVVENVKETVSSATDGAKVASLMLLFIPMVPVAVIFLKRKGITPATTPKALLMQVFNEMSKQNFGLSSNKRDAFDYVGAQNTGIFAEFGLTESEAASLVTPDQIELVLKFLRTIIDAIKKKKESGQQLTPDEQKIADMAPVIDKELETAKTEAIEMSEGTKIFGMDWKKALALLILIGLIIYFYFKK